MGGMGGFGAANENLSSNRQFSFSKMQDDIYEAVLKTQFLMDRYFMQHIINELNDDPGTKTMFFQTLFDKMHLNLSSIK